MVPHGGVIVITFHHNKWVMLKETPFKNHAHSNLVMVPKLFLNPSRPKKCERSESQVKPVEGFACEKIILHTVIIEDIQELSENRSSI